MAERQEPTCSRRAPGYFTLNGDKTPPAARDSSEVARTLTPTLLSSHRKRRAPLVFEQLPALVGRTPRGRYLRAPLNWGVRRELGGLLYAWLGSQQLGS